MVQLPKKLHQLEIFEQEGQYYVADLDRECVIPISEIHAEILRRAEELSVPQIINLLQDSYEKPLLFQAFAQLERWEKLGLIFFPFLPQRSTPKDRPYRLFCVEYYYPSPG